MQIGRRVMLRLLALMGFGFLFGRLGIAEDAYATPSPTPTPAMQAVLNTGQAVRDTLYRLLHEDGPWYPTSDSNKDNANSVHRTLDGWDHGSPPTNYPDLAKELARIKKEVDAVQIHPGHQHQGAKQCSGKKDIELVRCELEAIDALVREHYDTLKENHSLSGSSMSTPTLDRSLPDDKAIIALSSDITYVVNQVATLLEDYHFRTSKSAIFRPGETKRKDS
jgi:hypothetical protein